MPVFLFILDSLGTSELLLILVVALIFFGPRKLPQISRQIGKSLAEFRKASEDFKRTWEREVALETPPSEPEPNRSILPQDESIIDTTVERSQAISNEEPALIATEATNEPANPAPTSEPAQFEPSSKRDWL